MKLYNTASRSIETFTSITDNQVTFYSCGPTVYDYPHIGNWYTFIRYDLLARTLRASGYTVSWVMNITDVGHLVSDADEGEDKLEKGARREGKSAWDIAAHYTDYFLSGLDRLTFSTINHTPKATDFIDEQIALVKTLEEKGHTYIIDDGVYFDTATFPAYADFARLDLAHQESGARVEENEQKHQQSDFALWKFSPKDQQRDMEWDSPWGKGFPGWHLECSAMIHSLLGQPIDIHAGGVDHIPIHHTNEVAQSVAAFAEPLATYWMHCNHILVDGQKMSKSLGNVYTLEDIEHKGHTLASFRFHVLSGHYRSQSEFSWETLTASAQRLARIEAFADLQFQPNDDGQYKPPKNTNQLLAALHSDLNSPLAISLLDEEATKALEALLDNAALRDFSTYLKEVDALLGLNLSSRSDISDQQKQLIANREGARSKQDWLAADAARNELKAAGIHLRDTSHGPIWSRTQL